MKLADEIQKNLIGFCRGNSDIVLPNFYVGSWEMDVFKLTKSGFIVEYEIKISRSDFKADFKKKRSDLPDDWRERHEKGESTWEMERVITTKHSMIESKKSKCNRFFFVTPAGLLKTEELPKHAGLIEYDHGWLRIIKNAPLIHKVKNDTPEFMENLARSCAFRELNWRSKVNELKHRLTIKSK